MSLYTFPPRIINGTLYRSSDSEFVRGQILQTLSIVKGELVADPFFGLPMRLFNSVNSFSSDVAKLEALLSENIFEANFLLTYEYLEKGTFQLTILWEYQNKEAREVFLIDTLQE
jgi:hypothetical protein